MKDCWKLRLFTNFKTLGDKFGIFQQQLTNSFAAELKGTSQHQSPMQDPNMNKLNDVQPSQNMGYTKKYKTYCRPTWIYDNQRSKLQLCLTKLTLWSTVLLEKLTVAQLHKKFPTFHETQCSLTCSQNPQN